MKRKKNHAKLPITMRLSISVGLYNPHAYGRKSCEWDAFTASLAWGAVNWAFNIPPSVYPKELHKAGASLWKIASVWQIVANLVPSHPRVDGPLDCQIVGLTRRKTAPDRD